MEVMIVDIGSNSIKYDIFSQNCPYSIKHRSYVAGLIRYIKNGILTPQGMNVLVNTLQEYQKDAIKMGIPLYAFATASLRRVSYSQAVIDEVQQRTGIHIDLVSGELESELSLKGMLSVTEHQETGLMIDMGGGSTELNVFKNESSVFSVSCPFGALSLKNEFVKDVFPTEQEAEAIKEYVSSVISPYKDQIRHDTLYMVGGSAKAFAKLLIHKQNAPGKRAPIFTSDDINKTASTMIPCSENDKALLQSLLPDRYHLMLPSMIAYTTLLAYCGAKTASVSSGGVREGYYLHIINNC